MKIFITGTKGIPNQYGGFEQFAQNISQRLVLRGHKVSVYNPAFHSFQDKTYNKVNIIKKFSPEYIAGAAANYLYDYLCIKDAIKNNAEIILECGYASAVPSYRLLRFKNSKIITHVDGFEWQRTKWSTAVRKIIRKAERTAMSKSDALVCDHPIIQEYFKKEYSVEPYCIPYGAELINNYKRSIPDSFNVEPGKYLLLVARLEPENNIHSIIEGIRKSGTVNKLLVIGKTDNAYARRLIKKYSSSEIVFLESIFDEMKLNALRHFSKAYFHGHSVGGTNPSLLEAMAAGALIIAHDNRFNRYVMKDNGIYFSSADDIAHLLANEKEWVSKREEWVRNNQKEIKDNYRWEKVIDQYEELFRMVLGRDPDPLASGRDDYF